MGFQELLKKVASGRRTAKNLGAEEAEEAMETMLRGEASPGQAAAFLTAMRFKGSTEEELAGFVEAIRSRARRVEAKLSCIDCSGSYDGRARTPNLSVASSIVAAAGGVPVMIHGARNLPPKRGVTGGDVLEALGVNVELEPDAAARMLAETGVGFILESRFSPELERLRPLREELGFRTVINTAELLLNPARAPSMLIGVSHAPFVEKLCRAAAMLGAERVLAFQGIEGSDELPLRSTRALEFRGGEVRELVIEPRGAGLGAKEEARFASAAECAALTREVLSGNEHRHAPGVLLNAGVRMYAGGGAASIVEGVENAKEAVGSGRAIAKLEEIVRASGEP